jgi:Fe-S cluster biogenesis protein NfuA
MGFLSKILGVDMNSLRQPADPPSPARAEGNTMQQRVEAVLEEVRPALHADGGDIELVEVVGNSAKVRLVGACDGCPSATFTLQYGIQKRLRDAIPEFEELISV